MRIALVANTAWSLYNFRIGVIRAMIAHGHEVHVIAPEDAYRHKLIAAGAKYIPVHLDNYGMSPLGDLSFFWALFRKYRKHNYDLVYHYTIKPNIYGSMAAHLARVPRHIAITTGLGRLFRFQSGWTYALVSGLYRLACRCADEVWFLNESDRQTFLERKITTSEKTKILPSEGVNTTRYRPLRERRESGVTRFLFAGRLLGEKGIYEYIAAARQLRSRSVRFEVLGFVDSANSDSVSIDELTAWQQEGIIRYLGSTEDVRPYIDRADAIVLPSYYQEGISRILLEAMSMATPVITTDQVGCRDIVDHGKNGLICQLRSVNSLVDGLQRFLDLSWERRMAMGQHGRRRVQDQYSEELIVERYMASMRQTRDQLDRVMR